MNFSMERILESKRAQREKRAALPVAEEPRMLDALRERALTLCRATRQPTPEGGALREEPPPYRAKPAL